MTIRPQREHRFQVGMTQALGAIAAVLGLQTLFGWIAGVPLLTSFSPNLIPMAPSTGLLFVLLGTSAFLMADRPPHSRLEWPTRVVGSLGLLISGLLLVLSWRGVYWEGEHLGIPIDGSVGGAPLGHMSPVTALALSLGSLSLLLSLVARPGRAEFGLWPAIGVVLIGFVLSFGYFAGAPLLYGSQFIPPALPTTLGLLCLGGALMALAGLRSSSASQVLEAAPERAGTTLLLTYLVLATGMVTAAYLYFRDFQERYQVQVEQELSAIAGLKALEIARWQQERLRDGAQFLDNAAFADLVQRHLHAPDDEQARELLLAWMGRVLVDPEYDRVRLLDADGGIRLSIPESTAPDQEDLETAAAAAAGSSEVVLVDLHRVAPDAPIQLNLMIPIAAPGEGARFLALLDLRIDPRRQFFPLVNRWPTTSPSAETVLLRRDGDEAVVLNELRLDRLAALIRRISLDQTGVPAVQAVLGHAGIVHGVEYDGIEVLAGVQSIPDTPWFLEARVSREEILEPLGARRRNLAALVVVLLLATGTGTGWIWRQRQLQHLRDRAELQRQSEARYRGALDNMLEGGQIIGFDWRYLYLNDAAARYGRQPKEVLLGHTVMEMYPGIEVSQMFADLAECMQSRQPRQAEYFFEYPDGSTAWFEFSIHPVPEGIFILSLDITARKEAAEAMRQVNLVLEQRVAERTAQLQAANQELEAFAYSISHDLRAPLRAIDGFSRLLQEDHAAELGEEARRLLGVVRESTAKMSQLITDILALSRVSRGELKHELLDMELQARSVFDEIASPEVRASFELSVDPLPPASVDPALIRQVWVNLLSNAVKYSMPSAARRIHIGARREDRRTVYFVRDSGVGFDSDYAHKLFGVFQRLHSAKEFEGTGIGLAIVQRIIRRHGGEVWAEGSPGQGATFSFSLPQDR